MRKRDELINPTSCLAKAQDNEPLFILRAQDITAPETIRTWLALNPNLTPEKRVEAQACIKAMEEWPRRRQAD